MALSKDEQDTFSRLSTKLKRAQPFLRRFDDYYEGEWQIEQLGMAVPPELRLFITVANWCRTAADAIEERQAVEGFRLAQPGERGRQGGADEADMGLWETWQHNSLDVESHLAHLDSRVLGRSYVCVGSADKGFSPLVGSSDTPIVTVESPLELIHENDPRTRLVSNALRLFKDGSDQQATLYLPDKTLWLHRVGGKWKDFDADEHDLGLPPVVPLPNRARTANRDGRSELVDVIPITDATCRALTNAQIATEVMAIPQRFVTGVNKSDFLDSETGEPLETWQVYMGRFLALTSAEAKMGQLPGADLGNFVKIVEHYATLVAGIKGLPARYFGQNSANPPSAEGINADEARLVLTVKRCNRSDGEAWERAMRIVRRFQDGDWDPRLAMMETLWANPETPTRAQAADAATKLVQSQIVPVEVAREDLGYSAIRRARMRLLDQEAATADPILKIAQQFDRAPTPAEVFGVNGSVASV